jgi:hypothetical protein
LEYGDRIVIKVYGKTTHSSPVTLHWLYQGTTNTSHVESGYFVCEESIPHTSQDTGIEFIGILFGIVGGLLGGILVLRRERKP